MQRIRFDAEAAVGGRWNLELLVAMAQRFETLVDRDDLVHRMAKPRARAVCAEQNGEGMFLAALPGIVDDVEAPGGEIHRLQTGIEMQARTGGLGGVEQGDVQTPAMHGPDDFGIVLAVTQQLGRPVQRMHHASAHHYRLRHHLLGQAGLTQAVQAALGQRQVDRASAFVAFATGVGALLENLDVPAALRQQGGEQGTGQAGADHGDFLRASLHSRSLRRVGKISAAKRRCRLPPAANWRANRRRCGYARRAWRRTTPGRPGPARPTIRPVPHASDRRRC